MKTLSKKTRDSIIKYGQSMEPCSARAQCYTIAGYEMEDGETIADRFLRDHVHSGHAHRHAYMLVEAGCATKDGGIFDNVPIVFEDGSELN